MSGGTTPKALFLYLLKNKELVAWKNLCIFWADERCVLPTDNLSNYKMTYDTLFKPP
ncbi:MAG: hypothetical protein HC896_01380 [Bacteroidales bacterium]|nr:hypothetical protein [Bacteroidales bacterium]